MRKIAIVDDHVLLTEVLRRALTERGYTVNVLDADGDILAQTAAFEPDVVLLDLQLGTEVPAGRDLILDLTTICPNVVVVSGVTDQIILAECLELGAAGVLSKAVPFDELVEAIAACLEGQPVAPSATERVALSQLLAQHRRTSQTRTAPFAALSARECEVLAALVAGKSPSDISETSFVAISTVRSQIKSILRKLDVTSQLQAVALATSSGWRPPSAE